MQSNSSTRRILSALKGGFKKWALTFAIAAVAIAAFRFIFVTERGICSATVNFSYDGVESGLDPDGNRFDPMEMKSGALVEQALEALGESVTPEDAARVQDALIIQSNVPSDAFENIVGNASIYGKELSTLTEVKSSAYFPTQYTLTLHYRDAGLTKRQSELFLGELLKAYERNFYETYGYNLSFERILSAIDYESYDYIESVEILRDRLSSFRAYLTQLEQKDNTRFVSRETGYSFATLVGAIDTIQAEDVQWLNSYIISNNLSKDKDNLIDYYQYKIQDAERTLEQRQSRLYTLNELIENYVKTNAVFSSVASEDAGRENASAAFYEFSQPSEMYDSLINQKVDCQTDISSTQEQIALFERRIQRLRDNESSGSVDALETRLTAVREKISQLLKDSRLTADEFFKSEKFSRAFQTLGQPKAQGLAIVSTVKNSIYGILVAELALFGVYVLSALRAAYFPNKRKASDVIAAPMESGASKEKAAK